MSRSDRYLSHSASHHRRTTGRPSLLSHPQGPVPPASHVRRPRGRACRRVERPVLPRARRDHEYGSIPGRHSGGRRIAVSRQRSLAGFRFPGARAHVGAAEADARARSIASAGREPRVIGSGPDLEPHAARPLCGTNRVDGLPIGPAAGGWHFAERGATVRPTFDRPGRSAMVKKLPLLLVLSCAPHAAERAQAPEPARWERQAERVTIVRDSWGLAHIHGKTDADAVFGMVYAQAEDDFNRVETNYLNSMGRLAEAEGEAAIWQDLRMKLFIDPEALRAQYAASPGWLRALMDAWADGLNYYLATHPAVKPRVIARFEPWMALSFTEGSIGGDIERIDLGELAAFYGENSTRPAPAQADEKTSELVKEPSGSNGFAVAPARTAGHHALLLINPHTSFYFRSELQVSSDDGLDAYGAVTWGQFFVYQGFNDRVGWMHTSTGADAVDEYAEAVVRSGDRLYYRHGKALRPLVVRRIEVPYRTATGMASKEVTVYRSHHGPIVRSADGKWI